MDVYSGRAPKIASAPVRDAFFDRQSVVSSASRGLEHRQRQQAVLPHRRRRRVGADQRRSASRTRAEVPIGFSADNKIAYLRGRAAERPGCHLSPSIWRPQARTRSAARQCGDPAGIIYRNGTSIPVGAFFMDGKPRTRFLDNDDLPRPACYRSLEAAFGGDAVRITSQTSDGRLALVQVWSDRNPGDFYIFDTVAQEGRLPAQPARLARIPRMASTRSDPAEGARRAGICTAI